MRKIILIITFMASVFLLAGITQAADRINWGRMLNASVCNQGTTPVIDVTQGVNNDVDSGFHGNWALDNLTRHIRVWDQGNNVYCAIVSYQGQFYAPVGVYSPGAGTQLQTDINGTFQGGYQASITGTLNNNPEWATQGSIGTIDYGCNLAGVCPGYQDWTTKYFTSVNTFDQPWWGWVYQNGNNAWNNVSSGSFGDIL